MEKHPTYIPGEGWRYEKEGNMHNRMHDHDYLSRSIYMITISVEDRKPILGKLVVSHDNITIEPTALGKEVERCWYAIRNYHPEVGILAFQLMPDHIHGLLFVRRETDTHLGKIINGFKIGCNKAFRALVQSSEAAVQSSEAVPQKTRPKHPKQGLLFEPGYQDSVLKGKDQLEAMFRYIEDNPRRLAIKRMNPDLFRVVSQLTVGDRTFAAIGNRWLLDRPIRMQVRCHNNTSPENLRLIEKQKAYFLQRAEKGGVVVSPCISAGEKEIARAALDAHMPLIVILEKGFAPMYKPPGKYFDACAQGLLLMLAPWPYHADNRTITRQQCNALNKMAEELSTEPWTPAREAQFCSEF